MLAASARVLLLAALAAASCNSDLDCSLNGECQSGKCVCDAAWLGEACDTLALLPSAPGAGTCDASRNGTATGYTTTWGGHPVLDADGVWHAHVAEMAQHCGMCSWGSQSQVAHYSSTGGLAGPYARVGTAVGAFSHNPSVISTPSAVAPGGDPDGANYLMFHIGIGCDSAGVHACNYSRLPACTNGSTPLHPRPAGGAPAPPPANVTRAVTHTAAALAGPWRDTPADWRLPSCSNPSPLFLANGSLMLMCHGSYAQCGPDSGGLSFFTSLTADWKRGSYGFRCLGLLNGNLTHNGTLFRTANEDPHLYADARGRLHILTHNQSPCYSGAAASFYGADVRGCGGHFFSADGGESWRFAWRAAYNGTVRYTDGVVRTYKRERPKVVQDAAGSIIGLATGIGVALVDAFAAGNDTACTLVARVATGQ